MRPEEVRRLLRPLAAAHAADVVGRLAMLAKLNAGRRADIDGLQPPTSPLTSLAEREARTRLSPALLNPPYRTYAFGAALGALADGLARRAAAVPAGRADLLRRYGAFDLAIACAPFRG